MTVTIPDKHAPDAIFQVLLNHCNKVGHGSTRDAYEIPGHPDKVLKVSNKPGNFTNWAEIVLYTRAKDKSHLAEIFSWSWSGMFVVMEKLDRLPPGAFEPSTLPRWLNDKKPENFGKSQSGEVKALDYAMFEV